eukprot:TRINITY_DN2409_c0_g1_i3.p1 TRINITY_DN2409_c0_g1~~TRINITY_DN2409_c0_g1_i3.p1  ORF type:complete len:156 (+),score=42.43 TRINITY_DN2409_c0_g1_i3:221-688(+)
MENKKISFNRNGDKLETNDFKINGSKYKMKSSGILEQLCYVNLFPDVEGNLHLGKQFARKIDLVKDYQYKYVEEEDTDANILPKPKLYVRFAPPGAVLPKKIKKQNRLKVDSGWDLPIGANDLKIVEDIKNGKKKTSKKRKRTSKSSRSSKKRKH